jgi:hypothetical protein
MLLKMISALKDAHPKPKKALGDRELMEKISSDVEITWTNLKHSGRM